MIYLSIPNFPDPQAPGTTFTAFAKINRLSADFAGGHAQLTLGVYRTLPAMAANAPPVATLMVSDGGRISGNRDGASFPAMAAIQADNAASWAALWEYLLAKVITLNGLTAAAIVTE